jgi:hypothetical protein
MNVAQIKGSIWNSSQWTKENDSTQNLVCKGPKVFWGGNSTHLDTVPFIGSITTISLEGDFPTSDFQSISSNYYTNSIFDSTINEVIEIPYTASVTEGFEVENRTDISQNFALSTLPLFFGSSDLVKLPSKIKYSLSQIPRKTLKLVHPDYQVAYELCLLFASQLTSTYFEVKAGTNPEGWKSLNATYLMELVGVDSCCYKRVREVLEYKLDNGAIIECDYKKVSGSKNYHYRFGSWYLDSKIHAYKLKSDIAKANLYKHYLKAFARASENSICRNLFYFYIDLRLPTIQEIEREATRLIKLGFKNKKGKKLARRNKQANSYFKNYEELTFVEDAIEIFKYLTNEKGIMIPTIGGEASGGRVVDSFTLMPGWIRNLVTYKGVNLRDCDYSCLHPNIVMHEYGGSSQYLTHEKLAEYLKIEELEVKIEHLSFFNKQFWQMKKSPLFKYYQENEPWMLENLINEKLNNEIKQKENKHKITSRRLFKKEVEIMTDAIEELNHQGIYVMYVYDALFCHPKDFDVVKMTMNKVILEHGVKTRAK